MKIQKRLQEIFYTNVILLDTVKPKRRTNWKLWVDSFPHGKIPSGAFRHLSQQPFLPNAYILMDFAGWLIYYHERIDTAGRSFFSFLSRGILHDDVGAKLR